MFQLRCFLLETTCILYYTHHRYFIVNTTQYRIYYDDYHDREISGHYVLSAISIWNGNDDIVKVSDVR
jgi:hypothetical protein